MSVQSFLEACATGNVGVVEKLLESGVDPNQVNEVRSVSIASTTCFISVCVQCGQSGFYCASRNGHDKVVRVLLAAKALVNTQTKVL